MRVLFPIYVDALFRDSPARLGGWVDVSGQLQLPPTKFLAYLLIPTCIRTTRRQKWTKTDSDFKHDCHYRSAP